MINKLLSKSMLFIVSLALLLTSVFTVYTSPSVHATAPNCDYQFYAINNFGEYYDPCDNQCAADTSGIVAVSGSNKGYDGGDILSEEQVGVISTNKNTYEQASAASGVPWQMIAVLHLRETGLKLVNPSNGQGIYQDYAKSGGPYPEGPVTKDEFLRQSVWAGNFIKGKSSTPDLLAKGDESAVKDAFFGYNGRAGAYTTQAKSLGFQDGYDGSPYVVNKLDALRDPTRNPTGWGQIKSDGGSIVYPANEDYGAFVVYASLAGIKASSCASSVTGNLNEKIVQLTQAEYALWRAGTLKPGDDYKKYTYETAGDWCAWFVSYILKEAGKPVDSTEAPQWPAVRQFLEQSASLGFIVHQNGDGYQPKPGDLAIYGGHTHINIVTGYDSSGRMVTIGGNQGAGGNGSFTSSKVSESYGYGSSATSYVEVK